ncbi:hypothetical protein C7974DRAFT_456202 [Boeremia exigua]|uniref:uncharacterized protein n=1 Tax=Boeremia exigua TaxID=749465 RepID=UPI001E8D4C6C|nr:uncharacterized protein C7974DRAFT_456202 [Boeremia exigua]KAH6625862.1 hypothetical protein C7974DRAFT_456202 [Boeremia exigua]
MAGNEHHTELWTEPGGSARVETPTNDEAITSRNQNPEKRKIHANLSASLAEAYNNKRKAMANQQAIDDSAERVSDPPQAKVPSQTKKLQAKNAAVSDWLREQSTGSSVASSQQPETQGFLQPERLNRDYYGSQQLRQHFGPPPSVFLAPATSAAFLPSQWSLQMPTLLPPAALPPGHLDPDNEIVTLRVYANPFDQDRPVFSLLRIHRTDPFGPYLKAYCEQRGKIFRQHWSFAYLHDFTMDNPHHSRTTLTWNMTPNTVAPGIAMRNVDSIYIIPAPHVSTARVQLPYYTTADFVPGESAVRQRSEATQQCTHERTAASGGQDAEIESLRGQLAGLDARGQRDGGVFDGAQMSVAGGDDETEGDEEMQEEYEEMQEDYVRMFGMDT